MAQFINHYSSLIFLVPALIFILFLLLRGEGARWKQFLSIILVLFSTVIFFLYQPGGQSLVALEAEHELLMADKPLLLEFYSDY